MPLQWSGSGPAPALTGSVEFQACNDTQCLAPASMPFRTGTTLSPASGAAGSGSAPTLTGGAVPLSEARRVSGSTAVAGGSRDFGALLETRGLFAVLLLIFLGGWREPDSVRVSRVPLTVGFFGREARDHGARLRPLDPYWLGMATTYSVRASLRAVGQALGAFLQNPLTLAVIAAILVAMASRCSDCGRSASRRL